MLIGPLRRLGYRRLSTAISPDVAYHVEGDAMEPRSQGEALYAFLRILSESGKGRLNRVLGGTAVAQQGTGVAAEFGVMPLHHLFRCAGIAVRQAPCERIDAPHVLRALVAFGFRTRTTRRGREEFHLSGRDNGCIAERAFRVSTGPERSAPRCCFPAETSPTTLSLQPCS